MAIELATKSNCPILLDDKMARRIAHGLGLAVIGTAGILIKAKQSGKVPAIAPLLDKLQQNRHYYSAALVTQILKLSGE